MKIICPEDKGLDISLFRHEKSEWIGMTIYHATDGGRYEWEIRNFIKEPNGDLVISFQNVYIEGIDDYVVKLHPEKDEDKEIINKMDRAVVYVSRDKETETVWFEPITKEEDAARKELCFFRNWGTQFRTDY